MTPEDLTTIEHAGRRCSGCQTGRNWRRFEVIRAEGRDPIVTCPACRARLTALAAQAQTPVKETPEQKPEPAPARRPRRTAPRQGGDRLKRALRTLPAGTHSTGRIAKAAGLNEAKVLPRLRALEAAGEIQRVGKQWSTERPSTDLDAAFDRLQARTSNLRIIRPREPAAKTGHD